MFPRMSALSCRGMQPHGRRHHSNWGGTMYPPILMSAGYRGVHVYTTILFVDKFTITILNSKFYLLTTPTPFLSLFPLSFMSSLPFPLPSCEESPQIQLRGPRSAAISPADKARNLANELWRRIVLTQSNYIITTTGRPKKWTPNNVSKLRRYCHGKFPSVCLSVHPSVLVCNVGGLWLQVGIVGK